MKLKPLPRFLLVLGGAAGLYYGISWANNHGYIPQRTPQQSLVPQKIQLPDVQETPPPPPQVPASPPAQPVAIKPTSPTKPTSAMAEIRFEVWAWNAQAALIYANGGPQTVPGSLIDQHGARVRLVRQDDTNQMQADLLAFATALAGGDAQPSEGTPFVIIMGDGTAQFFAAANPSLGRICPDCTLETIAGIGYSRGEDAFMAPPAVKIDPQKARGLLVAGVLRDGDWNIAQKWAADNEIATNPDDKTYDPNAINWVNADDYVKAAEMYVTGYCENRRVAGNVTQAHKCVDGVVTWTPGDVTVAMKKGGLVKIVSTKEYRWQMGTTIVGIKRYVQQNRAELVRMLDAVFEAGDRIKTDPAALQAAMQASVKVYREETPDYWLRYYRGVTERDATGLMVSLGGSTVNNLADAAQFFGLSEGGADLYGAVYTVFGNIVKQQYPRLVPSYPAYATVVDKTLVAELLQHAQRIPEPDVPAFNPAERVTAKVGDRSWQILFDTGKATFTPGAEAVLQELFQQTLPEGGVLVEIHGHTDNSGSPGFNMRLSQERALAVKQWLQRKAPTHYTDERLRVVPHGDTTPLVPNDSAAHMAQNRRVQIVVGTGS